MLILNMFAFILIVSFILFIHFLLIYFHYLCKQKDMLSPVIKELLETKLEKEIRYPSDVEYLSYDIEKNTGQRVSTTTLKRLLGFVKAIQEPRLFTLDAVARYIDFKNWDELMMSLNKKGNSDYVSIEEIKVDSLEIGEKINFTYSPNRNVSLQYLGNRRFRVIESENSKLQIDDEVEVCYFILNYPLIVEHVYRKNIDLGTFTAGKISGITSLSKI